MEKDIRRVLGYVFKRHTGSEVVAREWLRECWREAKPVGPAVEAASAGHGEPEPAGATQGERTRKGRAVRASAKRGAAGGRAVGRICEYCGGAFEGRRADAIYCCKSHRNMASRKKGKNRGRAA
jgi:hypothetical protein